jgi:hypothetical protein
MSKYIPAAPRSIPTPQSITVRDLMNWYPIIHIDDKLMQRMFNQWPADRVDSFLLALYEGTGRATPLVFANVNTVLQSLYDIRDTDGMNESVEKSIQVFENIKSKNKKYVLLDGQHRFKHLCMWIQPNNEDERYYPTNDDLDMIFADMSGKRPKYCTITGQAFCDLPDEVKEDFYTAELPVIIFTSGHLKIIQKAFKVVNSSTMPEKMSIRMISMSPVVEFIRDLINPVAEIGNIEIRRFLSSALSGEKADDKREIKNGLEKIIAISLGWMNLHHYKNWSNDEGLDEICDYTSKVTSTSMKQCSNVWAILANGFVSMLDLTNKKKVIKIINGQQSNWSNILNFFVFTHSLVYGTFKSLKDIKKIAKVTNPILYVEELIRMVQILTAETAYLYIDKNGEVTPDLSKAVKVKNPDTNKSEPKRATVVTTVGNKTVEEILENSHGFGGHNQGTDTRKLKLRLEMMEAYFTNRVMDEWIKRGIITLIDANHSTDKLESLFTAVVVQKYQDSYLGEKFSPMELADGSTLSDNHFGKNYSEGGSTTLIGSRAVNTKLGKKKIAPAE